MVKHPFFCYTMKALNAIINISLLLNETVKIKGY